MRQTLFVILLKNPLALFEKDPTRGDTIGIGLTIILLFAGICWAAYRLITNKKTWTPDDKQLLTMWGSVTAISLIIPYFLPYFAKDLNSLPVFGYGMMLLCAFASGCTLAAWRAKSRGYDENMIWDLGMWLLIAGVGGARLFFCLQYGHIVYQNVQSPLDFIFTTVNLTVGGVVLYGGLICGLIAFLTFSKVYKISPLILGDIIIPSVFIGLGFGRIGCLLNGCCYGDPCQLPWGIPFPEDSIPWGEMVRRGYLLPTEQWTPPLHPTQIYSSINGFLLCAWLIWAQPYIKKTGGLMAIGLLMYPICRFMEEMLRADELGQLGTGLTISQLISLGTFALALIFSLYVFTRPDQKNDVFHQHLQQKLPPQEMANQQ
jgi:phosphatidylglycerol:prolipoprotein diacylglycerol transferase